MGSLSLILYLKQRLKSVEKFALKVCLKRWDLSYNELLPISGITSLESRRVIVKLLMVYKIIYKMIFFDKAGFVPSSLRRSPYVNHPLTITTYLCSSDQFKYSSIVHMIDLCNSLVIDVRFY